MYMPTDGFMLLSLINTALRDKYSSFEELCGEEDADPDEIRARLLAVGYAYSAEENAFKPV